MMVFEGVVFGRDLDFKDVRGWSIYGGILRGLVGRELFVFLSV